MSNTVIINQYTCDKHRVPLIRESVGGVQIWICVKCVGTPIYLKSPSHRRLVKLQQKARINKWEKKFP